MSNVFEMFAEKAQASYLLFQNYKDMDDYGEEIERQNLLNGVREVMSDMVDEIVSEPVSGYFNDLMDNVFDYPIGLYFFNLLKNSFPELKDFDKKLEAFLETQ